MNGIWQNGRFMLQSTIEERLRNRVMENAHLKKENKRFRDVLSKLPDEDEIEALVLQSYSCLREGTQTLAENIAHNLASRMGKE